MAMLGAGLAQDLFELQETAVTHDFQFDQRVFDRLRVGHGVPRTPNRAVFTLTGRAKAS